MEEFAEFKDKWEELSFFDKLRFYGIWTFIGIIGNLVFNYF